MAEKHDLPNFEPFVPRRFLRNRHAQTLAGNFLPRKNNLPEPEERLFHVEEDIQVLCHCHWQAAPERCPTVIIVHGLESSSLSQYVVGAGNKGWAAGMNVVRMNMRYCGFTGAQDYYTRSAAARVVDKIAVPALVIHAQDDPFIRLLPETRAKILANPHITLLEPEHGGHCAFLTHPNGYDGRWAERQIIHFFLYHGMN